MRKHYLYNIQLLALLSAFTACSSEDDVRIEGPKTPVALSVGVEGLMSRASVITDEVSDKTFSAFGSPTDIWMVMQSDYKALSGNNSALDEKDYKGSQGTKYCVTYGTTGTADVTVNPVNISGDQIRYWDDAHARSSALSIWALAVPGKKGAISASGTWSAAAGWGSSNPTKTIDWTIATAQNATTVVDNDLCFSNNIADYTPGKTDRRMKYSEGTFDEGKLVFYHALSKITIKLVEGDGFKPASTEDFTINNITLNGFKVNGTFDVADGAFSSTGAVTPITSMYVQESTAAGKTLEALVMPGTNLSTAALTNAVDFSIDGNAFKVSSATLVEKLRDGEAADDWTTIEAGKNYIFTFRVSKTGVKVTATVKEWEVLNAAQNEPKITVSTAYGQDVSDPDKRTAFTDNFTFLRSTSIDNSYTDFAEAIYDNGAYFLTPDRYWPDHNTHYFFRGVWPVIDALDDGRKTPTTKFYGNNSIVVENAPYAQNTYPSDLMIGYPRTTSETCSAHSKVVATYGICATEGDIRMNFQHVMSQIEVKLTTSEPGSKDRVTFNEFTKVEIVDGYNEGYILLSDGSSSFEDKFKADPYPMHKVVTDGITAHDHFHDAIIPQTLLGDSDNIKFRITVKSTDGWEDKYETLLGVKGIPVKINGIDTIIDTWEPGKKYVYTLYITKTGIKVTATIKDWIEAKGSTTIWM